jgi:multidrug efflux pump subunit AcrA (membrane-fusion protein)
MTANMTILTGEKKAVLAVPQRSVLSKDGKKIVRIVTDTKKKTYTEVEVSTGIDADGGLVEIVGGLQANQEIVTFINKK